ncbi:MAG: MBL fold metallo-hydrolase [Bacillaceae bacterium]|nr:MBL fold metallo-hydrolase [Bacillaceae bacterium]
MANATTAPRITSEELHTKMKNGENVFILDVRNEDEYKDWKIEGKTVESMNVPYVELLDDEQMDDLAKKLPKEKEIVVVCAKGGASDYITENLQDRGFKAYSLQGGMLDWSQYYDSVTVAVDQDVKIIQVNRLSKGCLSYVIVSEGKAAVIDPGRHIDEYKKVADRENADIQHVLDTHVHADHISGGEKLAEETGATYYVSSSDLQGAQLNYEPLENHDVIEFGSAEVKVLALPTPGHTPGSVSFLVNDKYFLSGDTVFVGGLGRPDLGGKVKEWAQDLYETVFTKIKDMADDVIVLPAHFAEVSEINDSGYVGATLGEIRKNNEILRTEDRKEFTDFVESSASTVKPPNFEDIIAINRKEKTVSDEEATELEIGPNRCAVHHGVE